MARGKAAPAAVETDTRTLKSQAVARVQSRRQAARYASYNDPHSDTKVRIQIDGGGGFADPQDLAEWVDMRVARCGIGTTVADTLVRVFEALRGGVGAVPDAVRLAAYLDAWGQYGCWMAVRSAPSGPGEIGPVLTAVSKEWRRQGLQDMPPPAAPFGRDPMDRTLAAAHSDQVPQPAGPPGRDDGLKEGDMAKITNSAGYPPKDGSPVSITSTDSHPSDEPKPHLGGGGT